MVFGISIPDYPSRTVESKQLSTIILDFGIFCLLYIHINNSKFTYDNFKTISCVVSAQKCNYNYLLMIFIILYLYLAPTGSPSNIVTSSVDTTSFTLTWDPPTDTEQNGVIKFYEISITGTPFDPPQSTYIVDAPTPLIYPATANVSTTLIELEENNDYTVTIAAINSEGRGPVSTSSSTSLPEAG